MKSKSKLTGAKRIIHGQPSWRLSSDQIEAFVTEAGGQLGPVTFERKGRKIRPFSVAPWAEEKFSPPLLPILQVLRGDFFCLPFGGNATPYRGEKHPLHGETANARWRFQSLEKHGGRTRLHLSLQTKIRRGRVDKKIYLAEGQNTLYSRHLISGMSGPMNMGHHAMLKFPDEPGSGLVSTSPIVFGQVFPAAFELAELGGYSSLKQGAEFDSLQAVPMANGDKADLTHYPARLGYEDLVMVVSDDKAEFAWTAVAYPKERFVWFALKDPRVLRETVLWLSNRGRHYPPWNGRHVSVLGLEEVTANFHFGLAESAGQNPLSAKGIPTCLNLDPGKPLAVNYIMGIAHIPAGFDKVVSVEAQPGRRAIALRSASGRQTEAAVDLDFLPGNDDWDDKLY
jgi:hypothetical protein